MRIKSWCGCAILLACLVSQKGFGEEPQDSSSPALDSEALAKMHEEFARPVAEHEILEKFVGQWNTETRMIGAGDEDPTVSKGSAMFRMLMGGRYLQQYFRGDFNGQPYEGMGLMAYDKVKQKYIGTWIDSMNTGVMLDEATYDPQAKMFTHLGSADTPTGPIEAKTTTRFVDKNRIEMIMYTLKEDGQAVKVMEVTYKRK